VDPSEAYGAQHVLVTGAAGFIGSHLVDGLVAAGARVTALDDLSAGRRENLAQSLDRIRFVEGSVLDAGLLARLLDGVDAVFHLAANASVPRSSEDPRHDFTANVEGTFRLLDAVRGHGRPRIVFASSAAVYGEPISGPMDEDHPLRPQSPYGGSKLAGEFLLEASGRCFDIDVRRVRIFNTYGPRQRRYVMYDLLEKLRRDPTRLEVIGTGDQERDYNFVADSVAALMLVGAHPDARGGVYNVAGGRPVRIRELVALLLEELPIPRPEVSYTMQSWRGDVARMIGVIGRLGGLGYTARHDLRDGLRRLIAWHRAEFSPPW
jgi:UDP-glucose 4-epimerase